MAQNNAHTHDPGWDTINPNKNSIFIKNSRKAETKKYRAQDLMKAVILKKGESKENSGGKKTGLATKTSLLGVEKHASVPGPPMAEILGGPTLFSMVVQKAVCYF